MVHVFEVVNVVAGYTIPELDFACHREQPGQAFVQTRPPVPHRTHSRPGLEVSPWEEPGLRRREARSSINSLRSKRLRFLRRSAIP